MSAPVDSFVAAVTANYDKIATGIQRLHDLIVAFNNSPGTLSAADQAALDKIQATSQTLADAASSVDSPVIPPAPTVP